MHKKPNIVLSTVDLHRLETLLDALAPDSFPGMAELEEELARAQVVEPHQMPSSVVTMNSTVKFKMEPSGEEFSMTLVYPGHEDASGQKISVLAPVGSALLGLAEGDDIHWPNPNGGTLHLVVQEVEDQPERAGHYDL